MLRPFGLYFLVQLCLASGINADSGIRTTLFSSNGGNRVYLQMFPPSSDRRDAGKWPTHSYRDTESNPMSAVNTSVDVDVWFTEPLIKSVLQSLCERVTDNWDPAFRALCSESQTVPACVSGTCLIKEADPVDFSYSDGFRFGHNDTIETGIMSNQQHMTLRERDTEHSHEAIVIMEEDPAVFESATYLYERYPNASTLLKYIKGSLHVLRGSNVLSTKNHDITLVGHGSRGPDGTGQLAGHGPEEIARVVSTFGRLSTSSISSISIISCNLGNEQHFMFQLLQVLRSVKVEAKLHLYNSFLSVSSDGQIMTRTGQVWMSHDHSRRVTAELDQRGDLLTRVELGCAGPVYPDYKGNVLYFQTLEWPSHPQMFVPMELRKKYKSIECLEGLTWSLFFEESEKRRAPDYDPDYNQRHMKPIWLIEPGPEKANIVFKHIVTIQDVLVEIRYNAREDITSDLYYVFNDCIYKVQKNLSVSLVGKFLSAENQAEIENFRQNFNEQQGERSLQELREGLKASKFNDFCRQTFQYQQCSYNCERWGQYFMAAVFSASIRNFRTFSLFVMSVIGCEVGRSRGTDSPLCTAFIGDEHPMITEQSWPGHLRRGFYGCTVDNYEMAPQDRQIWLDQVVAKENSLYIKSKQMMNSVDHDEQTELDIFGKVKIMNKYVFSSYMEFFRGTPEGKNLKRGCAPTFHDN